MWTISDDAAWFRIRGESYRHYSGAAVVKHGNLWSAETADGISIHGHKTALDAISTLRKNGRFFWCFGQLGPEYGKILYGHVEQHYRPMFRRGDQDQVFMFCWPHGVWFPEVLKSVIRRQFLGKSTCLGCGEPITKLQVVDAQYFDGSASEQNNYLGCACGYPVWSMELASYYAAREVLKGKRPAIAGGDHSRAEICEILEMQEGRCIYCNKKFTIELRPTKDHLLASSHGGADWALNIVMACRSCNSNRCNKPFRTYCKFLSPAQNRRILRHLGRRLLALESRPVSEDAFAAFEAGLAMHDSSYLRRRGSGAKASPNLEKNRLLPRTAKAILKKIQS